MLAGDENLKCSNETRKKKGKDFFNNKHQS